MKRNLLPKPALLPGWLKQFGVFLTLTQGCLIVPNSVACVSPPTNMISWWRWETNLVDSADSNHGQAVVGPTFASGRVGLALSNSVVTIPDAPSLRISTGMTVHAWLNLSAATSNFMGTILSKYELPFTAGTPGQSSFYFGVTNSHLMFLASSNGLARSNVLLVSSITLTNGGWYFVAATYDHTHITLYINGVASVSRDFFSGFFPATNSLFIGGTTNANPAMLPGIIDELTLYNRRLTIDELNAIMNADGTGVCPPPLTLVGPRSLEVPFNEDAQFSVSAIGIGPFSYQWRFNGTNLLGATNSSLYLEHVQSNRAGLYSVAVSNSLGSVVNGAAQLTVLAPNSCVAVPGDLTSWWPGDRTGNDAAGINNAFTEIVPPFETLYATGKVAFGFATRFSVQTSSSVNFGSNTDFTWEGWIKAPPTNFSLLFNDASNAPIVSKVSNSIGYELSLRNGQLALFLGSSPVGNNALVSRSGDLRDGRFHHVACSVSRRVANSGYLYVDGTNVLNFNGTLFNGNLSNNATLFIGLLSRSLLSSNNLAITDELALYHRALDSNEIATIFRAGAAGKCKPPPVITLSPGPITVIESSNATFTVAASGLGLRYQWLFNGANITGARTNILTLTNVTVANAGFYSVRITNLFGTVTSAPAILTIHPLPVAVCTNVVISADNSCTASASVDGGSYLPGGGLVFVNQDPPGPYPLGTNVVTIYVRDNDPGVVVSCISLVVVLDMTAPTLRCPTDLTVEFADIHGAPVAFSLNAVDTCSPPVQVVSQPPSGSIFPIGTTRVQTTAMDRSSNRASCGFQITVLGAQGVLSNVLNELIALRSTVGRRPDEVALNAATQNLAESLSLIMWTDDTHLTRNHGEEVFNNDKAALQELSHLLGQKRGLVDETVVQGLIDRIVKADRLLASMAVQDAIAAGVEPDRLVRARDEITSGDDEITDAKYESGIAQYRNAWNFALQHTFVVRGAVAQGAPVLQFDATPGSSYVIERSTNLVEWRELQTVTADDGGVVRFSDDNGGVGSRFYRARLLP